jgi:hypothetical protein
MALALSDLTGQIVQDTGTTLSTAVLYRYLNEAYKRLAKVARPTKEDSSIVTAAGQRTYVCPPDVDVIREVRLTLSSGQVLALNPGNRMTLVWPNETGQPTDWYVDGRVVQNGALCYQIGLDPVPTASYAGLTVTLNYVYVPPDMVQPTDTPAAIPSEWQQALYYYACAQVLRYDQPQRAARYLDLWAQAHNDFEAAMLIDQDAEYYPPRDALPFPGRVV